MKRLFWDIETSPGIFYGWRCGWKKTISPNQILREPAIICISTKWEGDDKVNSLRWDDGDDTMMLKRFTKIANRSDEMVAHNGDRFDLKWFNTRNLLANLPPLPAYKTVDTLTIARRHFVLQSNRLDYIAGKLFGQNKLATGFQLWRDVAGEVRDKEDLAATLTLDRKPEALQRMVTYCENDVVLLEKVWQRLRDYGAPATHRGVLDTGDVKMRWTCAHCGATNVKKSKTWVTAAGMIKHQMRCLECGRYYSIANSVFNWRNEWRQKQKLEAQS